jgi:hypothetical protein
MLNPNFRILLCGEQVKADAKLVALENQMITTWQNPAGVSADAEKQLVVKANPDVLGWLMACIVKDDTLQGSRGCRPGDGAQPRVSLAESEWLGGQSVPANLIHEVAMVR